MENCGQARETAANCDFTKRVGCYGFGEDAVSFADVQCAILPVSGDDAHAITKWIADFDRLMDTLGAGQNSRLIFARRLLSGSAAALMRSVIANQWNDLKEQLIIEFDRHVDRCNKNLQHENHQTRRTDPPIRAGNADIWVTRSFRGERVGAVY